MRLSGLSLAAILLFSTFAFAQHHESGSAPSAPPPAPPAAAPSPAPAPPPAPAPAPSAASSASSNVSHSSLTSAPPAASAPETHMAPGANSSSGRDSGPGRADSNAERTVPTAHVPTSERVSPDVKITGESKIVSGPRIGEESKPRPSEPDLRRRTCEGAACKEKETATTPAPDSDLRRKVCIDGHCNCPPGETSTGKGCVATTFEQCQPGQYWNGASCLASTTCPAGQEWNGTSCVVSSAFCGSINGRASILISDLRSLRAKMSEACGQNSSGQDCRDVQLQRSVSLQQYEMLWNEAAPACRTALPDPAAL